MIKQNYRGIWKHNTQYNRGDIVVDEKLRPSKDVAFSMIYLSTMEKRDDDILFICIRKHTSDLKNEPRFGGHSNQYWREVKNIEE